MKFKAVSKNIRMSPRKARLVADLIRGKKALHAQYLLMSINKRAAGIIYKTLSSAISNAKHKEVKEESLRVETIFIDGGAYFKRFMPRAMGRATMIRHRTSHITIILSDGEKETEQTTQESAAQEKIDTVVDVKKDKKPAKKIVAAKINAKEAKEKKKTEKQTKHVKRAKEKKGKQ